MLFRMLAVVVFGLWVAAPVPVNAAASEALSVGVFSTGKWYFCSDQRIAENIALTYVAEGGDAAMTLFNQNALVCEVSLGPTRLYVHGTVWLHEMGKNDGKMKVVLMTEWNGHRPSRSYYVLTQRTVVAARTAQRYPVSF